MRSNLPVSQNEYELADGEMLVSTTDRQGVITHCNEAFQIASGFIAAAKIRGAAAAVHRVRALVDGVLEATHQQLAGISQVNEAVGQLDVMTQRNAALAEESAASAETLARRTAMLRQAVDVFMLH